MPIATGLAIGLGALGAAGSIGGAAIASHGASSAAGAQASAAEQAAQLQHQDAQAALDFQKQVYGNQQQEIAPWLNTGRGALSSLANLLGIPSTSTSGAPAGATGPGFTATGNNAPSNIGRLLGGGPNSDMVRMRGGAGFPVSSADMPHLSHPMSDTGTPLPVVPGSGATSGIGPVSAAPATSTAPTSGPGSSSFGSLLQGWNTPFVAPNLDNTTDPGYKARLALGQQTLENSAAARGGLLSTGTAKNLQQFGQDYASNEYSNVYNRALTDYQQQYNIFNNNQTNEFNRLAAISGVGQTAASQLSSAGSSAAGNIGSILLNSGQQIGNDLQNAGAARASGYAAGANAFGGAVSGSTNNLMQLLLLSQMPGLSSDKVGA